MKNPKLLFWGSFLGAIAIVLIIAGIFYFKDKSGMAELEKVYADWKTVEGQITKFQARFPGEPEYTAQDSPIPDLDQKIQQEVFVGEDDEMSYFISAVLYPSEILGNEEENLRQALDGVVKVIPEGEIIASEFKVPFLGKNYLEYKIHSSEDNIFYEGRMFLTSNSLYQVYVSYPETTFNNDKFTYFANSFEIK